MAIALLLAPVCALAGQICLAEPAQRVHVDQDFEAALGKFVVKRFCKRVNATEEQRQKLQTLLAETQSATRPMRQDLRQGLVDLSGLMAKEDITDEQIVTKAHELRALFEKINDSRLNSILKVRAILTPDQRQQMHKRLLDVITSQPMQSNLSFVCPARINAFLTDNSKEMTEMSNVD